MNEPSKEKDNNGCMDSIDYFRNLCFKRQIFGDLILDLLSSHFTAYFSDTVLLVLLGVVIWRRYHIRYLLIQRVERKLSILSIGNGSCFSCLLLCCSIFLSVTIPNEEWASIFKRMLIFCSIKKRVYLICSGLIIYTISIGCNRNMAILVLSYFH